MTNNNVFSTEAGIFVRLIGSNGGNVDAARRLYSRVRQSAGETAATDALRDVYQAIVEQRAHRLGGAA